MYFQSLRCIVSPFRSSLVEAFGHVGQGADAHEEDSGDFDDGHDCVLCACDSEYEL